VIISIAAVLAVTVIAFILVVRPRDLPPPEPVDPFAHLDERKAAIYENLRDLQFEYRVGKLSETDYQKTKHDLQSELAAVLERNQVLPLGEAPRPKPAVPSIFEWQRQQRSRPGS